MRHRVAGKKLSRNIQQRKALFKNLINSLVIHGAVKTTEAKAKAVKGLAEKLITQGKNGTLHARRLIAAFLQNKEAVSKIVDDLGPIFKKRPGGFTRIVRLGRRRGDNTMMVRLELVEKPKRRETRRKPDKHLGGQVEKAKRKKTKK
jgi:large subunit ribosomal protein L17